MAGDQVRIKDLQRTTYADDDSVMAIDNNDETFGITVRDFNRNANATAYRHAQAAAASADAAAVSAAAAATAQSEVSTQVIAAQTAANNASTYAGQARTYSETAAAAVTNANSYATAAAGSANTASSYVDAAETQAGAAQEWAVGETNSAKYWAGVAQAAAGGGVTSFNGRSGAVQPQAGDYSAALITYGSNSVEAALGALETGLSGKMNTMTVDSAPTSGATDHLVSSAGVHTAVSGKMDTKTIDSTPTAGATDHLVSSAGVATALSAIDTAYRNADSQIVLDYIAADNAVRSAFAAADALKLDKTDVTTSLLETTAGKAIDATQLNENVSGSYAEGVASEIASLANKSYSGYGTPVAIDGYVTSGNLQIATYTVPSDGIFIVRCTYRMNYYITADVYQPNGTTLIFGLAQTTTSTVNTLANPSAAAPVFAGQVVKVSKKSDDTWSVAQFVPFTV